MTARPLTVIPLKYTGVPITQPEKIIVAWRVISKQILPRV
jgi:hypothetical protein